MGGSLTGASARVAAGARPAAYVLAAAVPPLFLHAAYQPDVVLRLGGVSLTLTLADAGVAAVAAAAVATAVREGVGPLARAPWVWAALAALALVILASTGWGALRDPRYPFAESLVSALKFCEYLVLAPSVALIVRRREDVLVVLAALVAWSAVAAAVGLLQFLGTIEQFRGRRPGERQPSWIGVHDFAALAGAVIAIAFAGLLLAVRIPRVLAAAAGVAGAAGLVLAAALDAVAAMLVTVAVFALLAARARVLSYRRLIAAVAIAGTVTAGALALRAGDVDQFLRFLGIRPAAAETFDEVQTHAHRTVLLYIGGRIFLDHPVFGVGWQGSAQPFVFENYVPDARRRFPEQPDRVFPAPSRRWGVQNAYLQAAADMGVVGLAALLGVFLAAFLAAVSGIRRAGHLAPPLALSWLLVAGAGLAALGLYAGAPVDALAWLGVGLAAAEPRT
ncbi:MAG TPA: O-antigen ligase family protein [Gaiellaceae bacterium]|nr:O-antigen ligase family protein [Gaiellaceae bacterium]